MQTLNIETTRSHTRISGIDIVRGIVMALMVIDHTRDWFGDHTIDPLDVANASAPLFFSRWITHLCAPAFVLLAGTGAFIKAQHAGPRATARYLFVRGLLLIIFEQTLLRCLGWYFNFDYRFMNANVLWGIGGSMMLLSACVFLPRLVVLGIGLVVVFFHSLLIQSIVMSDGNSGYALWTMLFGGGNIEYSAGHNFYVSFPIVPWFGVMALGYGLGRIIAAPEKKPLFLLALTFAIVFLVVRSLSDYGNPIPWLPQHTVIKSILSFVNTEKYPPSFLFTIMTLSITFLLLAVGDRLPVLFKKPLAILGKTPLFFYAAHIMLVHALAVGIALVRYGHAEWLYTGPGIFWGENLPGHPPDYGLSLPWVYGIAAVVIVVLYPCCRWFAEKKKQYPKWLGYT